VKIGVKIGEGIIGFWPLTNSILVFRSQTTVQSFIKFHSKLRPQERWQTHTQTHACDLIICPMLCYSNWTDKERLVICNEEDNLQMVE